VSAVFLLLVANGGSFVRRHCQAAVFYLAAGDISSDIFLTPLGGHAQKYRRFILNLRLFFNPLDYNKLIAE